MVIEVKLKSGKIIHVRAQYHPAPTQEADYTNAPREVLALIQAGGVLGQTIAHPGGVVVQLAEPPRFINPGGR